MTKISIVAILLCAAAALHAQDYMPGPDSHLQPGVPKGTVTKLEIKPGKFYPGTPHNYSIYVPAQYDAGKPAPFMIFLDGTAFVSNYIPTIPVLDNLIAKRRPAAADWNFCRSRDSAGTLRSGSEPI